MLLPLIIHRESRVKLKQSSQKCVQRSAKKWSSGVGGAKFNIAIEANGFSLAAEIQVCTFFSKELYGAAKAEKLNFCEIVFQTKVVVRVSTSA